jgi:hypothetical protein
MAIELGRTVHELIGSLLAENLRYRSLIFQSNDFQNIQTLATECVNYFSEIECKPHVLMVAFDEIDESGASSCQIITRKIDSISEEKVVIIKGPLQFLDYWGDQISISFWQHLSTISGVQGIIIIDTIRNIGVEGPYVTLGRIKDTDIRYLKSRLVTTESSVS